jgi:S1-C subfamily serine protease
MKIVTSLLLALLVVGCAPKEHLVRLSEQTLPKTTSITVAGVIEISYLKFDGEDTFSIETATVPVRVRGAGVYISENNHVLTCDHLFALLEITTVTVCDYNAECFDAEIVFRESDLDLALLRTPAIKKSDYARIANPRKLRVGQEVLAIGNPLGFPFSVSHGIISALNRDNLGIYNMTQSDAFINPGNSGGGLFNMKGELVGINSRMVPPIDRPVFTGLGFSVQSGQIVEFLTRFRGLDKAIPKYGYDYWAGFKAAIGWKD